MMERRQLFAIDGLFCAGCAHGLERRLSGLDGIMDAGVHFVTSSALIRWDSARCEVADISRKVADAGYRLVERHGLEEIAARFDREVRRLTIRLAVAVVFGMWSMGAALILYAQPDIPSAIAWWIALTSGLFAVPVLLYSGAAVFRMAWRSVRLGAPGLDLLIAIGATGAVLLSLEALLRGEAHVYFDTATMLVTLLLVGRLIETRVRRGAILALSALEKVAAAELVTTAEGTIVSICSLQLNATIMIDAGATALADGVIVTGESMIDRAVMTGESIAVPVGPGDRIQAGVTNLQRRLTIQVDRVHGDRDIDRMGGRIAIEIASRGEPARELDRWVGRLLVAAPLAATTAAVLCLAHAGSLAEAATRALAALIIICPCALAIAAPLAHIRAAVVGGHQGIRIADPAALEALATLRTVVFDKTGTLTQGVLRIDAVEPTAPFNADDLLACAANAEHGIDHPIARALGGDGSGAGGKRMERGAEGSDASGRRIRVTSAATARTDGRTWLDVTLDDLPVGSIGLADTVEPAAATMIAALRNAGVTVFLATGDSADAAGAVAETVGIPEEAVHAGCSPADKARLVGTTLRPVVVVGDGVNDAPAIAAADCGITVSRAHAAAAATAGLLFEHGGIETFLPAWHLALRTRAVIRQNFMLALGYNLIALPLATLGLLTPLFAAVAMLSSSCFVTLNAMRVR
ncbi:heavy metal translocating P-type ATPase [Sphingobium estronivorans]|uniref:heavy metal translocating P-type ATPase n=1 Tax=Sphingobium estronivorans TaxID=1577690 RepID=UPI00123910EE|nr:HAD-IC family P-type ATPase [Sphingobium estronivorans]